MSYKKLVAKLIAQGEENRIQIKINKSVASPREK